MRKRRGFPENVSEFKDRHGKFRLRFRRTGQPAYYFKSAFGTPDFERELAGCRENKPINLESVSEKYPAGSIGDLVARFYASTAFRNGSPMTQRKVRSILDNFRDTVDAKGRIYAEKSAATVPFERIDEIIARKAEKYPAAAAALRKQLRRLFEFAVKLRIRPDNPVELTSSVKVRTKGFHAWTEEEISAYRAKHPLGTNARLAMELLLWTGQRKGDVVKMGGKDIKGGRIDFSQQKTGKPLLIMISPQLRAAIQAMPVTGRDAFLVTSFGKPYTANGFGNAFKGWCREAGLDHCCTHGLRKAMARRAADLGGTNQQLKAVGGWSNDTEVALYTRNADQKAMADGVIEKVSTWEANLQNGLAKSTAQTRRNAHSGD